MKFEEVRVSHSLKYHCAFLDLYEDEVRLPNGKITSRVYIEHLGAAAVLPITIDKKIVLTRQFRYPIGLVSLEVPAGKKDEQGESSKVCAIRELEEETSYVSKDLRFVQTIYNCLGYSNEAIDLYIAFDCDEKEDSALPDEDEFIETVVYSIKECKELLFSGKITDVKTALLLQHYLLVYGGDDRE
jgi:ADP-ribose pyrophosphatase